jgi:hypothetical protein
MKNVICATSILALVLLAQVGRTRAGEEPPKPEKADSNAIEFTGKVRTGIVAIGGETTGTTVSANGKSYELDFRQNSKLRALARTLNGKDVVVRGTLQQKEGVEIRQRRIIMVAELRAADAKQDSPPAANTGETSSNVEDKAQPSAPAAVSDKKDEAVRKLTVVVDPVTGSQWSAKPGVRVASDEKEVTALLGEAIAKQVKGKIDFAKEDLAHVGWGTSGPPFGELQYEIQDGKDGTTITFYIKEPKVEMRGMAFRLGNDFFVVPKKATVKFSGTR